MMLLDLLLNAHERRSVSAVKIAGCFFLILGGGIGVFFLFQALVPLLGYVESGAITCAVLIVLGTVLIFIGQQKKASPPEETLEKALSLLKDFDIEKFLKNNALLISLLSLGMGLVLSQIKNVKSLSHIYKFLK